MYDLLFDENDFAEEINENKIFNNVILTKKDIAFKYFSIADLSAVFF